MDKSLLKQEISELMEKIEDNKNFISKLQEILTEFKDEKIQQSYQRYIPNMGKNFGTPLPVLWEISKELGNWGNNNPDKAMVLLKLMWQGSHEEKMIVSKSIEKIGKADFENSLKLIESFLNDIVSWDICDTLATSGMSGLITSRPGEILSLCEKWVINENKWIRRIGIVTLIPLIRLFPKKYQIGEKELRIIEKLIDEEELDVKKAVAWVLREISKKDQKLVYDFLLEWASTNNKNTKWIIKNGMKRLSENLKNEILAIMKK